MKRSFLPILIVLAVLLSAAASAEVKVQRNARHLAENGEKNTENDQTYAQNSTPLTQQTAQATNSPKSESGANQTGRRSDYACDLLSMVWGIVFSGARSKKTICRKSRLRSLSCASVKP